MERENRQGGLLVAYGDSEDESSQPVRDDAAQADRPGMESCVQHAGTQQDSQLPPASLVRGPAGRHDSPAARNGHSNRRYRGSRTSANPLLDNAQNPEDNGSDQERAVQDVAAVQQQQQQQQRSMRGEQDSAVQETKQELAAGRQHNHGNSEQLPPPPPLSRDAHHERRAPGGRPYEHGTDRQQDRGHDFGRREDRNSRGNDNGRTYDHGQEHLGRRSSKPGWDGHRSDGGQPEGRYQRGGPSSNNRQPCHAGRDGYGRHYDERGPGRGYDRGDRNSDRDRNGGDRGKVRMDRNVRYDRDRGRSQDAHEGRSGSRHADRSKSPRDRKRKSRSRSQSREQRRRRDHSGDRSRSPSRERRKERRTGFGSQSSEAPAPTAATAAFNPAAFQAALQPPVDPAEVVRRMMGMPGATGVVTTSGVSTAGLTVAQKRALLWGSKKAEANAVKVVAAAPEPAAPEVSTIPDVPSSGGQGQPGQVGHVAAAVFGTNRWDAAGFNSEAEKAKFLKIMGVKGTSDVKLPPGAAPPSASQQPLAGHYAMTRDVQEKVLQDMETAYARGLAQTGGRTGLGADK